MKPCQSPFGAELRRLRMRAGVTQQQLAAHLRCWQSDVSFIERGIKPMTRVDFHKAMRLMDASPYVIGSTEKTWIKSMKSLYKSRGMVWDGM